MKKSLILILLSLFMMMAPAVSFAQERVFQEVAKMPGAESVFVGSTILKLAKSTGKVTGYSKYTRSVKNLESIEVISCEKKGSIAAIAAACQKILDSMNLDVILEANEDGEQTLIYGGPIVEGQSTMKNLIVVNRESDEFNLVYVRGDIDISDVLGNRYF